MWKKTLLSLIVILILLSSYALYVFFQNNKTTEKIEINDKQNIQRDENTEANDEHSDKNAGHDDYQTRAFHIEKKDCDNECADFEDDVKGLYYCQNYCGLLPIKNSDVGQEIDCEEKTDLARDYCYRDKAINSKDIEICEKISDRGIKEHCKNRVTEDIIDESF